MKDDSACASAASLVQENIQPTLLNPTNTARKCLNNYLNFIFTFIGPKNYPVPQCAVWKKFSNKSIVPSKLKKHLNIKHNYLSETDKIYLDQLLSSKQKQAQNMEYKAIINDKTQLVSYTFSKIVTKKFSLVLS